MSSYVIELDDTKIIEQIDSILNTIIERELRKQCHISNGLVAEAAKEIVYSHKEQIINAVVSRATKEIVKKGLPKLLEKMNDD